MDIDFDKSKTKSTNQKMNEENTRAELIEPLLEQAGWGRNFPLTKIDRCVYNHFGKTTAWRKSTTSFCGFCF